ncbi:TIGR00341 family protein [Trichlorobacter lovleyi]|uniref:TIGR00341 family protein n=1 Tax=Trichlorobacter lovleyi TaxID=313985 RepID=UPI00223F03F4|nr:TIGR00341 family protein [Trichlorobacter lovleyi]QOX78859.1 TIGR00341 family protein [Trichlorobacter lovleyi]
MTTTYIRYYLRKLKAYLAFKTEIVNHQEIIKEMASGGDHSWIYYLMLLMAGLIALLGLLTNSVAVVIGAMLISPLMGPIISSGLAVTIGDLMLARRAFRTIAISVFLTILLTAIITLLSPLKEPTAEILSRVRPNIYDLFVAMFSGIVGAVALCTKRNYLITATGVAVATAVIPPLSVTGYGLGTGQMLLGMGGFLLFFTNFVAIVLTSNLVFFIMGFRSSQVDTHQHSRRTRLMIITGLLSLISIPLIYTLVVDIKKVNTRKRIERVLKNQLNIEKRSRMTSYSYVIQQGKLVVRASVNTTTLIARQAVDKLETELKQDFQSPVDLQLEQVLVASEKVPEQAASLLQNVSLTPPPETSAEISAKVERLVSTARAELNQAFAPFPVADTRLTFSEPGKPLVVTATLQRDYPVSDDERLLLSRQLERALTLPVKLAIAETALLPPLQFNKDKSLSPASIKALAIINQLPGGPAGFRFLIESSSRKNNREVAVLKNYLTQELGLPEPLILQGRSSAKTAATADITLKIVRREKRQ